MILSRIFKSIKARLPIPLQFLIEVLSYWRRLCRYNACIYTNCDIRKMQYTLLRENHIIEKGMSIRDTRRGFGQTKVLALIERLQKYNKLYGDKDRDFLIYPLSTIKTYISYQHNEKVNIPEIEDSFTSLCYEARINPEALCMQAGIEIMQAKDLRTKAKGDFKSLLYSRHSIRYFKDQQPSKESLEQALELASRTPSACNRQAWHTHIYFGDDAHELLQMQGGCNGFSDDIPCCVVVTADMKGFLSHEPFQCFIDGGLYAQNLINALHFVGLGAIPLSCGFFSSQLLDIQKRYDIPKNEVMIVIIGTGITYDEMKIAVSARKSVTATNKYHVNETM